MMPQRATEVAESRLDRHSKEAREIAESLIGGDERRSAYHGLINVKLDNRSRIPILCHSDSILAHFVENLLNWAATSKILKLIQLGDVSFDLLDSLDHPPIVAKLVAHPELARRCADHPPKRVREMALTAKS